MLCLVAGLTLCVELMERGVDLETREARAKAFWCGLLLSLGACIRIANGPLVLLPPLWLLLRRRQRLLLWLLAGSLLPAALFALVDLFTWGKLAGSFVAYVKFNFVEGKAADFGTEPPLFYYEQLFRRLRWTLGLVILPALWGVRASWPYVVQALLTLAYLSTQAHKEDRFILVVWPLLLIAGAGVLGPWLARLRARESLVIGRLRLPRVASLALAASLVALWFVDALLHRGPRGWPAHGRIIAQAWAGRQPDVTALLFDYPIDGGGALWFGNDAPHMHYKRGLLQNPLVSHVLVQAGSERENESKAAGFTRIYRYQRFVVLARKKSEP
jgi:GPI mannosyltransferase 3